MKQIDWSTFRHPTLPNHELITVYDTGDHGAYLLEFTHPKEEFVLKNFWVVMHKAKMECGDIVYEPDKFKRFWEPYMHRKNLVFKRDYSIYTNQVEKEEVKREEIRPNYSPWKSEEHKRLYFFGSKN